MEREGRNNNMDKVRVLLVDDEVDFIDTLAERLKLRDLQAHAVHNGEKAVSYVEAEDPDVMVLDLKMPGMDGMQVLRKMKNTYSNTQVIMLTGHGTDHERKEAEKLGAFAFLNKPVELQILVDHIKKAYETKLEKTVSAMVYAEKSAGNEASKYMEEEKKASYLDSIFSLKGANIWFGVATI
jgi:DNA-binding NtrC family response regulator